MIGVAYAVARSNVAKLEDIKTISDWGPDMTNHFKIPSVYSYSPSENGQIQWGANIDNNAVTMVNTKLELDVQDNKIEELELLLQVLDGTCNLNFEHVKNSKGDPEYTWRDPEVIVTDYLTQVFKTVQQTFKDAGTLVMGHIPVDIVITVPVVRAILRSSLTILPSAEKKLCRIGRIEPRTQRFRQFERPVLTRRISPT